MNLDLFAGAGGWEAGGLDAIGIELDPAACATRRAAGLLTIRADVARYPAAVFAGKVEGLVASPPCQDFSQAGKRRGLSSERGQLVWQPGFWTAWLRPRWAAFEQVPDVLEIWQETAWELAQLGYSTWTGILNAADYGVPQTRRRAILIASLDRKVVCPPAPTHSDQRRGLSLFGLPPWVTMAEALGWGGGTLERCNQTSSGSFSMAVQQRPAWTVDQTACQWSLRTNQQTGWVATASGNDSGHDYEREGVRPAPSVTSRADRWTLQRPATTVQADPRIARPGHKGDWQPGKSIQFDGGVKVTLEQAATLQAFPPAWPWRGTKTQRFTQVGNAIPPPLAAAIVATASTRTAHKEASTPAL
jgi:DNA (cytosine-5)-methyltransferase 1